MQEPGRENPRVTSEDQRVDPATARTSHPGGGRTAVHLLGVKAATLRERGRSKVSRKLVRGPYHAGESGPRVKASSGPRSGWNSREIFGVPCQVGSFVERVEAGHVR